MALAAAGPALRRRQSAAEEGPLRLRRAPARVVRRRRPRRPRRELPRAQRRRLRAARGLRHARPAERDHLHGELLGDPARAGAEPGRAPRRAPRAPRRPRRRLPELVRLLGRARRRQRDGGAMVARPRVVVRRAAARAVQRAHRQGAGPDAAHAHRRRRRRGARRGRGLPVRLRLALRPRAPRPRRRGGRERDARERRADGLPRHGPRGAARDTTLVSAARRDPSASARVEPSRGRASRRAQAPRRPRSASTSSGPSPGASPGASTASSRRRASGAAGTATT